MSLALSDTPKTGFCCVEALLMHHVDTLFAGYAAYIILESQLKFFRCMNGFESSRGIQIAFYERRSSMVECLP